MEDSIDTLDTVAFAQDLAKAASDLQASEIVLIDLRGLVAYTDGFVVCSGRNRRHVLAIAHAVRQEAKKTYNLHAQGVEGAERGQWVLVDFGDIVVHIQRGGRVHVRDVLHALEHLLRVRVCV
jgi:ribosome-associated protein